MANGGFGRGLLAAMAATLASAGSVISAGVNVARQYALPVDAGRWSYKRKGKRTTAQVKRAARKKRNRQH